jgi:hypothetical protein
VIVVEVMGRDAGWIAYASGVAGGAHVILVPEKEIDIDHVCALLKYNYDHGKHYGVVVVAEGCHLPEVGQVIGSAQVDSFGHARLSGIGEALAELIEKKTGFETRSVNLGHTQRGGVPTAYDRVLGQRYGLHAIDMVHDKKWGRIAVLKGTGHHRHHDQGSDCDQSPAGSALLRCDCGSGSEGLGLSHILISQGAISLAGWLFACVHEFHPGWLGWDTVKLCSIDLTLPMISRRSMR